MDMGFAFRVVCFPNETPLKRTYHLVVVSRLWVGDYVHVSYEHRDTIWQRPESPVHSTIGSMSSYVHQYYLKGLVSLVSSIPSGSYNFSESYSAGFCEHQGERFDGDILFRTLPCLSVSVYCPTVDLCVCWWWTWLREWNPGVYVEGQLICWNNSPIKFQQMGGEEQNNKGIQLICICRQIEGT